MKLIIEDDDAFLSYAYLQSFGIGYNTIKKWGERRIADVKNFEGKAYVRYKDIPAPTRRKKLPPEAFILKEHNRENAFSKVKELLHQAYYFDYTTYKSFYEKESSFTTSQVTKFAQLHSVFQSIIDLKKSENFRQLTILHEIFNEFFPGKYKTKQAFSQAILKAQVDGIVSVAMDKRTFGNNDRTKRKTTPSIDYAISALVACDGKFTNPVMLEKANKYFEENGLGQYSLSWMKKQRREWLKNPEIYKARYGQTEVQKILPYPSLKNANYSHVQWQMDGVIFPYWEEKFHRSVLVFVIDNCSKKIIGYAIGNTENSEVIESAIRNAVYNTGVLPFELVMDRHSFTQTQSALNFEALMKKVGGILTKTSNPRQKIIVERYIQNLNSLFKEYPGYLGQSIRSKSIEAVASDELKTQYAKNFKSKNEIVSICSAVIEKYNNKPQRSKSPNMIYLENPHPSPIKLNQFHRAELLPYKILKKIDRGQITIMRGVEKYEYSLPAELYQQWNNEHVVVTHDNLQDGIYLYNKINGEGIAFLRLKEKINNAKALQTPEDIQGLYRNKGKLKGIESQARKRLEYIRDEALNIDPEAYEKVNKLTTPKNIVKELQESSDARYAAQENGAVLNQLDNSIEKSVLPLSLRPKKKNSNPFTANGSKLEVINLGDDIQDD